MKSSLLKLSVFTLALATLTACGHDAPLTDDPQAILDKAWVKLTEEQQAAETGELTFSGKASFEVGEDKGSLEGSAEVEYDSTDKNNLKSAIELDVELEGTLDGQSAEIDLEGKLRNLNQKVFVYIDDLSVKAADPQVAAGISFFNTLFKSKWITLPAGELPTGDALPLNTQAFISKEVAEVAKNNPVLDFKKDLGGQKFEVEINPQKLRTYLSEASKVSEIDLTEDDLNDIELLVSALKYTMTVTINNDYEFTNMTLKGSVKDPEEDQTLNIDLTAELDGDDAEGVLDLKIEGEETVSFRIDFDSEQEKGASVNISEPDNAETINPFELLGGLEGAGL